MRMIMMMIMTIMVMMVMVVMYSVKNFLKNHFFYKAKMSNTTIYQDLKNKIILLFLPDIKFFENKIEKNRHLSA